VKYKNYDKHLKESVNLKLETKMAMPTKFVEQCQWADVIIIAGGDDELLQHWMLKFNIPKIWEGKVVTGLSAGADFLVNSFYTSDWRVVKEGLGIFPIKFIPHYKSDFGKDDPRGPVDWKKAYEELENYGDKSLPIYALEEGDFVVFEK
jgi:peptidase E